MDSKSTSKSGPDRRGFLIGAAATGALASMSSASVIAQTKKPRRLIGVLEGDPPVINAAISSASVAYAASTPVYNALTFITHDERLLPELAESWEMSPDGLSYTFHLRKDVAWHDDAPFTSADVKFSIENVTAKLHPRGKAAYGALERVDTPDRYTVVYRLRQPQASLLVATDFGVAPILPKHLWEGTDILRNPLNHKPVGTGPFKFAEYIRGQHLRYVRNENYFVKGKPAIDELTFRIIPNAASRVAAFEQGEIDMIYYNALPQADVPRLAKRPGVTVTKSTNRGAAFYAIMNLRSKPLDDVRVRHAIAHAVDRAFIIKAEGGVTASPMKGPLSPISPLYNKNLPDYEFSVEKANALLDEAGLKRDSNGIRHTLSIAWPSWNTAAAQIGQVMHQNLEKVGIAVKLEPMEMASLHQKAYVGGVFDITIEAVALGPDPDISTERFYNSKNIVPRPYTNNSAYRNEEVDRLFDEQRVQTDFVKRKALYDRIQELIWRDLPILPIYAYAPNNIHRSSYATGFFDLRGNGAVENFVNARLV